MSLQSRVTAETMALAVLASVGASHIIADTLRDAPLWVGLPALGASWIFCGVLAGAHLYKIWTWADRARQTVEDLYLTRAETGQLIRDGWGIDYPTGWDNAISEAARRLAPNDEGDN